ncbi:MAG TPA: pyridoxine 5'-phosphate synthase [Balneolales bacterium]|nr:pyridoxine 5'-phosphate synthase [Balneolales bacterium]
MKLLINIDHIATLRNARGEGVPDIVKAAQVCEEAGAEGIVFHLREDRRHIKDEDVDRLSKAVKGTIDFEMAATDEMLNKAAQVKPHLSTLVPEKREELTTEGGLQLTKLYDDFSNRVIPFLQKEGIAVSLFIDPDPETIQKAIELHTDEIELHTGTYANAENEEQRDKELERLKKAAQMAHDAGIKVNAGHGLNFDNIELLLKTVPHLNDVSIGHAIICDAIFNGLGNSVRHMLEIVKKYSN